MDKVYVHLFLYNSNNDMNCVFSCTLPKVTYSQKFAFAQRSGAMKAPVGLLSDRTVLHSKMEGPRPDKFAFAQQQTPQWGV